MAGAGPDLRGYGATTVVPGKTTLDVFAADFAALLDRLGILAQVSAPALVVAGDEDAFPTRADAERMQARMPHAELVWLAQTGHMPNLERTAEFNAALLRFLDRCA